MVRTLLFILIESSFLFQSAWANSEEASVLIKKQLHSAAQKYSFSLRNSKGEELININGETSLAPASIAKTISTFCSLKELGPQYQFETLFGYIGDIKNETLNGDLVIQGSGDPSLVIEDLRETFERIRHVYRIKKITGKIIFDVSYFGKPSLKMNDGFEGDEGRSFAAELTPTPFNQNSFSVWIIENPSRSDDRKKNTSVQILPSQTLDLKIKNDAHIGKRTQISVQYDPKHSQVHVSGELAENDEKPIYRAVSEPYEYYAKMIQRLFIETGGEWSHFEYKTVAEPVKFKLLTKLTSRPLSKILMDINKFSLNMGAEMLLLASASHKEGRPASVEKSMKFLQQCLKEQGISEGDIHLTNASGLSREAAIKTSVLSRFLNEASRGFYSSEYLSSFSLLGMDGTTKSRLQKYATRARIKTGSIRGVRSITGYIYSKTQEVYTFALILNGLKHDNDDVKAVEDKVLELLLEKF